MHTTDFHHIIVDIEQPKEHNLKFKLSTGNLMENDQAHISNYKEN